eukprot:scaffold51451_cov34-Prasinocladus_malaysianus.AAC.1
MHWTWSSTVAKSRVLSSYAHQGVLEKILACNIAVKIAISQMAVLAGNEYDGHFVDTILHDI